MPANGRTASDPTLTREEALALLEKGFRFSVYRPGQGEFRLSYSPGRRGPCAQDLDVHAGGRAGALECAAASTCGPSRSLFGATCPRATARSAHPGAAYTLRHAAEAGQLVVVRCRPCRAPAVRFLASDLARLLNPNREADAPPFPCSRCGRIDYVKLHLPSPGDYGHLVVRRRAA
jgi:hypothetical protein